MILILVRIESIKAQMGIPDERSSVKFQDRLRVLTDEAEQKQQRIDELEVISLYTT